VHLCLDSTAWLQAAFFPVVGSLMLLLLYMFFDKIQFIYLVFNAFIAGICLEMVRVLDACVTVTALGVHVYMGGLVFAS
jgi:hypothetical protein